MFSLIDLTPEAARRLLEEEAVYIIPDGRMNIASLDARKADYVAAKLAKAL
jgi:aspartate/tyrosine/aromatic aminotransferase